MKSMIWHHISFWMESPYWALTLAWVLYNGWTSAIISSMSLCHWDNPLLLFVASTKVKKCYANMWLFMLWLIHRIMRWKRFDNDLLVWFTGLRCYGLNSNSLKKSEEFVDVFCTYNISISICGWLLMLFSICISWRQSFTFFAYVIIFMHTSSQFVYLFSIPFAHHLLPVSDWRSTGLWYPCDYRRMKICLFSCLPSVRTL